MPHATQRLSTRQALSERALKRWTDLLNNFEHSGLTQAEFIRREGLPKASFYTWHRRLRPSNIATPPAFAIATPPPSPKSALPAQRTAARKKEKPVFIELAVADAVSALSDSAAGPGPIAALAMIFTGLGQLLRRPS